MKKRDGFDVLLTPTLLLVVLDAHGTVCASSKVGVSNTSNLHPFFSFLNVFCVTCHNLPT